MQKIIPSLWFDSNAEEAVNYYLSVFKDAKIIEIVRYTEEGYGEEDAVMTITFSLLGMEFMAINGGPYFKFTNAVSFMVKCDTQEEIDYYWEKLLKGGASEECGWLKDKFGLSWQINPTTLVKMMSDKNKAKVNSVTKAMMKMKKLDIAKLQEAFDQG